MQRKIRILVIEDEEAIRTGLILLEETRSGTRLIHEELFSGLLAPIFCGQMEQGVPPMLDSMNQALKELAEQ